METGTDVHGNPFTAERIPEDQIAQKVYVPVIVCYKSEGGEPETMRLGGRSFKHNAEQAITEFKAQFPKAFISATIEEKFIAAGGEFYYVSSQQ